GALSVSWAAGTAAQAAATLKGEYFFQNNFNSATPGGPMLTEVDPVGASSFITDTVQGNSRTVFHFAGNATPVNEQAGFTLNTAGLVTSNSYSVELIIKFDSRDNN